MSADFVGSLEQEIDKKNFVKTIFDPNVRSRFYRN